MLTFIDLMGKKKNDDEPDSEENSGNEKQKVNVSVGWQDILVLALIALAIVGGYQYYQHTKRESAEMFARCALLYDGADYAAALACYDSTMELSYIPVEMDSLRGVRISAISDMLSAQQFALEDAQKALTAFDTVAAVAALRSYRGPALLTGSDAEEWNALQSTFADSLIQAKQEKADPANAQDSTGSK